MYADTLRSASVKIAARFRTRNNTTPNERRNLKGSWLRMSRLTRLPPLLIPRPGDRVYEAHDRHDIRQVMARYDLLEELHVDGARGPVVNPIRRIRTI